MNLRNKSSKFCNLLYPCDFSNIISLSKLFVKTLLPKFNLLLIIGYDIGNELAITDRPLILSRF